MGLASDSPIQGIRIRVAQPEVARHLAHHPDAPPTRCCNAGQFRVRDATRRPSILREERRVHPAPSLAAIVGTLTTATPSGSNQITAPTIRLVSFTATLGLERLPAVGGTGEQCKEREAALKE
jgi:hypothetical protein